MVLNSLLTASALLLILLCIPSRCYKILIYAPKIGYSHVNFDGKIADTLVAAGHDVLFYTPDYDPEIKTNGSKLARILHRERDFEVEISADLLNANIWTEKGENLMNVVQMIKGTVAIQNLLCQKQLEDERLLKLLKNEKFDLGISEVMNFCGFMLFHKIGLEKHISTFAVSLTEGISEQFGISNNPSFVPGMFSPNADTMSYLERARNFIAYLASHYIMHHITGPIIKDALERYLPPGFTFLDVSAKSTFVFVNAIEFLEFPRPINHKIVYIGGIAVAEPSPLPQEYAAFMDSAKDGAVLISFGSITKSSLMSNETKKALVDTFKKFSKVKFIWKYDENDDWASNLANVMKRPWVPQTDLLNHPNMRAFMSHGGLNSLLESVHAGVPIICIPLFGDQMRNAKMIEKRGVGIILDKTELNSRDIPKVFEKILTQKSFQRESRRLAKMIAGKPISSKELVIKHAEFAAKFGAVDNLEPASIHLNFFQYYLLDIILPFLFFAFLLCYATGKLSVILLRYLYSFRKTKKD